MITSSTSSLEVYSDRLTVAEISAVLELEPSEGGDAGDRIHPDSPRAHRYSRTTWIFRLDGDDELADDGTGFTSLRTLFEHFDASAGLDAVGARLALLRGRDCETLISWGGFSDSTQGGFVLPADLISSLLVTGCDLYGTAYVDGEPPSSD